MDNTQIIKNNSLKSFIPENGLYKYFSGGDWLQSVTGETIPVQSPIDNSIVGRIQSISVSELRDTFENAFFAFSKWSSKTMDERSNILVRTADIMSENIDILSHVLSYEIGKTVADSNDEVERTVSLIKYYAEEGRRIHNESLYSESFPGYNNKKIAITKRVPLGVVVAIPPFNYPINEGAPKIVGALIAGNTVVFKPSTQGAISALLMVECFRLAGIPEGVLNAVTGKSDVIGDELVTNRRCSAINFTGGTNTANSIKSKIGLIPLIAGLGGKDASIVCNDADIDLAVSEIAKGAFSYAGQRCTGIKRVLVQSDIKDQFEEKFVKYVSEHFVLGDPREKETTMGPVINIRTVELFDELYDDAVKLGAKVLLGGKNLENENRLFLNATILTNVSLDMKLAKEEPFAPILPIIQFTTIEEAVDIANSSEYGLQSSIFTKDINTAFTVSEALDVGTVQINGKDSRGPDHFPFIGVKASGIGQVQGAKYLIESMTRIKTIVINKK